MGPEAQSQTQEVATGMTLHPFRPTEDPGPGIPRGNLWSLEAVSVLVLSLPRQMFPDLRCICILAPLSGGAVILCLLPYDRIYGVLSCQA